MSLPTKPKIKVLQAHCTLCNEHKLTAYFIPPDKNEGIKICLDCITVLQNKIQRELVEDWNRQAQMEIA